MESVDYEAEAVVTESSKAWKLWKLEGYIRLKTWKTTKAMKAWKLWKLWELPARRSAQQQLQLQLQLVDLILPKYNMSDQTLSDWQGQFWKLLRNPNPKHAPHVTCIILRIRNVFCVFKNLLNLQNRTTTLQQPVRKRVVISRQKATPMLPRKNNKDT